MPKIIKTTGVNAKASIDELVQEYSALREQESIIKKRKECLASEIKDYALKNGSKSSTGSCYCESDGFIYGAVAKTSISFKSTAVNFLKERGFNKAIEVKEEPIEGEVAKLVENSEISLEELESITDKKTTYSVDVKVKQEVTDEVSETAIAASSKSKGLKSVLKKKR